MSGSVSCSTGASVSIDVTIVGSSTSELEETCRAVGIRASSVAVIELLRFAQPDAKAPKVIVLDMRQRTSLPPAIALLRNEHPSTAVVIVAGQLDPKVMLEAMRAGVSEWVTDPVTPGDLATAIQRVAGIAPATTAGDLFVVVGAKGGVGTTTVAVNLATTLASNVKASTLLIDLHPAGGDAALYLGAEPKFSLIDALKNTHRLDAAYFKGIVVKTAAGPDLLASPDHGAAAAVDPGKLHAVVEMAMRCYRYVVVDVGRAEASIDKTLDLASRIIVVATQELAAVRGGARTVAQLRARYGNERIDVVLNRYDREADIPTEDLERAFKTRIQHRFPGNYRLAIDALNKGRPIVVDNHNKLASSFAAHARSLCGPAQTHAPARPAGLLSKLTGRR
jgi:pilus assembly protein CpaE